MKNKRTTLIFSILGVAMLILLVFGATYAYFAATTEDNDTIKGSTASITDLKLVVEKISTSATTKLIPLDNDVNSLTTAARGSGFSGNKYDSTKSCIDKNGYSVCQVYKITVTNNSSATVALNGGVTYLEGENTPNVACAVMDDSINVSSNATCVSETALANNVKFESGDSYTYHIIVYINNSHKEQYDKGKFNGTVTFTSAYGNLTANFD